jgi:hypothetical protein
MCVLYFHEFNENLASEPIHLYHSDCVFCRAQNIVDPVMNFKSRNPGALMVKATYQRVSSSFHDVCSHYRSAVLLFTSLYGSAAPLQTLLLLTHSAPGKETTFSLDVRKRNDLNPGLSSQ